MLRKSEASTEFLIFLGFLLVFFVFFIAISGFNNKDIQESAVYADAKNILYTVVNEINAAARIEGYYREFSIPEKLSNDEAYVITIYTNLRLVKIEWSNNRNIISNIITDNIVGSIIHGKNKIKNENGVVKINES